METHMTTEVNRRDLCHVASSLQVKIPNKISYKANSFGILALRRWKHLQMSIVLCRHFRKQQWKCNKCHQCHCHHDTSMNHRLDVESFIGRQEGAKLPNTCESETNAVSDFMNKQNTRLSDRWGVSVGTHYLPRDGGYHRCFLKLRKSRTASSANPPVGVRLMLSEDISENNKVDT